MCKAITKSGKVCKIKSETHFCHIHREIEVSKTSVTVSGACASHGAPLERLDPVIAESSVESTSEVKPSLDKQREDILQKICFCFDPSYFYTYQREAWPLFKDIDLTSETLDIIKRAKDLSNLNDETYDSLISTYFNDSVNDDTKYITIKDTILTYLVEGEKDILEAIQVYEIDRDLMLLFLKYALSRGRYFFQIRDNVSLYRKAILYRKKILNKYREKQLKKLRVKAVEKYTPICDDVRKYIIAQYL